MRKYLPPLCLPVRLTTVAVRVYFEIRQRQHTVAHKHSQALAYVMKYDPFEDEMHNITLLSKQITVLRLQIAPRIGHFSSD